ncbi:MAG: hypothetical protein RH949_16830 [Coleofasciculus sp. A1-SPW-01]|uniref:hypothetical protein n=1 Tax=Coleofasciculus sp. A1-SPW-01 TaxID=3070819 RepID=UPI0032FCD6B7
MTTKAIAVADYNLGIMLLNRAILIGDPDSMEEAVTFVSDIAIIWRYRYTDRY